MTPTQRGLTSVAIFWVLMVLVFIYPMYIAGLFIGLGIIGMATILTALFYDIGKGF